MHGEAIESVLERALGSTAFCRARRLRRFLEHVVKEELAGRGEQLKEYAIGIEVFERGSDFDPRNDTIVRVEAIKLRQHLEAFFRSEGATEPVRIAIPKGSYRPVFELRDEQLDPILDDPEALYWQARSLVLKFTPDHFRRAIQLVKQGIRRWPSSAQLHALLAEAAAGATCSDIGFLAPEEGLTLMRAAAQRALALDPDCGAAHLFAGLADLRLADKSKATAAARRALALAPDNASLRLWAAAVLLSDCQFGEAILHEQQAARLEPGILVHRSLLALTLFRAGRSDAAAGHLQDILAFEPDDYTANLRLSRALCAAGLFDEAKEPAMRACSVSAGPRALSALGYAEACAGHGEAAGRIVNRLKQQALANYVPSTTLALINIGLGRLDEAAAHVAAARRQGDFSLSWSKVDRRWDPLRGRVAGL
jgi:tetratricopeptide (TPR) repeat protein